MPPKYYDGSAAIRLEEPLWSPLVPVTKKPHAGSYVNVASMDSQGEVGSYINIASMNLEDDSEYYGNGSNFFFTSCKERRKFLK